MKRNLSVIPMLFTKAPGLSYKMFLGFLKMNTAKYKPRRNYGYNHLKNLCLLYFKLTPHCNLRCVMCGQYGVKGTVNSHILPNESDNIVSLDRYKKIIDEITPYKPVIYLWGGEPFLYPELFPLVKYMADKGLFVSVNTNGTMLEKNAGQIVNDKWSSIFVSLDGIGKVNDAIRGKDSYERVIKGIKAINNEKRKLKSNIPFLGLVTTVTNMNYLYLDEFVEISREWNIDLHMFNLGTYTNGKIIEEHRKAIKEKLNVESNFLEGYNTGYNTNIDTKKLYDILRRLHRKELGHPIITVPSLNPEKIDTYYSDLEIPIRRRCIVPWCQTNINYNGDVHFCADYPDFITGNIKTQSFTEIMNGDRANLFRKTIHSCENGMFPGCRRCYQNMLFGERMKGF